MHLPNFAILGEAVASSSEGPRYVLRREMGIKNKEKFRKWVANWGKNFAPSCDSVEEDINCGISPDTSSCRLRIDQ